MRLPDTRLLYIARLVWRIQLKPQVESEKGVNRDRFRWTRAHAVLGFKFRARVSRTSVLLSCPACPGASPRASSVSLGCVTGQDTSSARLLSDFADTHCSIVYLWRTCSLWCLLLSSTTSPPFNSPPIDYLPLCRLSTLFFFCFYHVR